jgi:hypothetical protein
MQKNDYGFRDLFVGKKYRASFSPRFPESLAFWIATPFKCLTKELVDTSQGLSFAYVKGKARMIAAGSPSLP